MLKPEHYFDGIADDPVFRQVFKGVEVVWEPLAGLEACIEKALAAVTPKGGRAGALKGLRFAATNTADSRKPGEAFIVERWTVAQKPVWLAKQKIFIGAGTRLEPTAIIKGPALIGAGCDIRQGAYIRGNAVIGEGCTIGHATEIKNSILMRHTEAGHFNYIGDSILGSHVNLGAGSKLANLQFRTPEEKATGDIRTILLPVDGQERDTRLQKMGAVLGDYVELGCNSVTCPGALIGRDSWIYPNTTVPKGYYPPRSFISSAERKPRVHPRPG